MHTKPMEDSEGTFKQAEHTKLKCPKCKESAVTMRTWESNCGGYEDDKYTCDACGYYWWVEGPDA